MGVVFERDGMRGSDHHGGRIIGSFQQQATFARCGDLTAATAAVPTAAVVARFSSKEAIDTQSATRARGSASFAAPATASTAAIATFATRHAVGL